MTVNTLILHFMRYISYIHHSTDFPSGSAVKNPPAAEDPSSIQKVQKTQVQVQEDPLEEGMATHSSILAWEIPWTEEPGRLQSMGSQRAGHV